MSGKLVAMEEALGTPVLYGREKKRNPHPPLPLLFKRKVKLSLFLVIISCTLLSS